jgi:hypothetical protein
VGLVGERRDSVAIGVRDMNSWEAEVASANVWELAAEISKTVDPSGGVDRSWIHEIIDNATKVVANNIALLADLEEVRRVVASQSEVVAIGGDGCFIVSTCGISSFSGVHEEEVRRTSTGECRNTGKGKAQKSS